MADTTMSRCGILLTEPTTLRLVRGQLVEVPNLCGKPANVEGPDGVMRCHIHDRGARGLSMRLR